MSLLSIAREASRRRGYVYFREGRVTSFRETGEGKYEGRVRGSAGEYRVRIDLAHPRSSVCDCPFAAGRSRICKHMIALYFAVFPREAESWYAQEERRLAEAEAQRTLAEELEKEREDALLKRLSGMTKRELTALVLWLLEDLPEWQYERLADWIVYGRDEDEE